MSFLESLNVHAKLKRKIEEALEKRVEARVKARLAQHKLKPEDFDEEELAIIYEDERIKLIDDLKAKGLLALLAALGISLF
ncbi:MAG: dihydrouridine synthase [Epsilonproteobacteria bacterium]|nr:dihydrouridine synthase [Campylobacterota bacterium]NPA64180.1 dihydrouridine synthase [Campylobacterota bacterium]